MTDARRSGIALIAGSAAMIITMAVHPHGRVSSAEEAEGMARMLIAVHSLAMASVPVLFLGAWGLSRQLDAEDRMAMTGLVIFGFGAIAVMNAAVMDGLVAPELIRRIFASAADAAKKDVWQVALRFNFEINQAYARVYAVASGAAIVLWSAAILRKGRFARAAGIYGCILGPVTIAAVCSGLLTPDVHGFGMLVVCQAIWFVAVGVQLCGESPSSAQPSGQFPK